MVHWIVLLLNLIILARFIIKGLSAEFLELYQIFFSCNVFSASVEIELLCLIRKLGCFHGALIFSFHICSQCLSTKQLGLCGQEDAVTKNKASE